MGLTQHYIAERPSLQLCLQQDLVNYSKLARQICKEHKLKQFDAVLIAIRRHAEKLKKEQPSVDKIHRLLKKSKLEIKNKMCAIIVESIHPETLHELQKMIKRKHGVLHIIQGTKTTLITNEEFLDTIKKQCKHKIITINENLVEISIKSPEDIEAVSGVLAYLTSLLAESGINIVEMMSSWIDTLFIVHERDLAQAMQVLRF